MTRTSGGAALQVANTGMRYVEDAGAGLPVERAFGVELDVSKGVVCDELRSEFRMLRERLQV